MRIAYCGYDFFSSCLQMLIENRHDVIKVFTVPENNFLVYNDYIKEICNQQKIDFSYEKVSQETLQQLNAQGCELLLTAAYSHIIPSLSNTNIKGINIHPSLLPVGRGPWPIPWTIIKQLKATGITIHKLSTNIDGGAILAQEPVARLENDNLESLNCKLQRQAKETLFRVMNQFQSYWDNATEQPSDGEYWKLPDKQDFTVSWSMSAKEIQILSAAFGKHGCLAFFNQQWWWVFDLVAWPEDHHYKNGETVHRTNTETVVACSDGLVCCRYFRAE